MPKPKTSPYQPILLGGVLIVALLLRLPLLNGSFWLDEAAQALESARPLWQQLDIPYDFQPPLLHLITHFAMYVSKSEWWLRTVGALIPGLVTIWATYHIGRKLVDERVGFWAALLMATSSFHIFFSQELRPYSLPAMWASLSWLVLLNWPNLKQNWLTGLRQWRSYQIISGYSLYALLTLLGLYSSYLYPFFILSQIIYIVLLKREHLGIYLFHACWWIVGFLPWIPFFLEQLQVGSELRHDLPGWDKVVSQDSIRSLALVFGKFMFGVLDIQLSLLFAGLALIFLIILGYSVVLAFSKRSLINNLQQAIWSLLPGKNKFSISPSVNTSIQIMLIWLVVPLLSAWLVSFFVPVIQPKRVLFLLPCFYMLVVTTASTLPHRKVGHAIVGLLLLINVYSTSQYYFQPRLQRENWRQLHHLITHLYTHKSVALFSFPEPFAPWVWYDQNRYPVVSTGQININQVELDSTMSQIDGYTYVMVFDYLRDLTDPQDHILTAVQAKGYQEMDYLDQDNIGFVRIYAQPQVQVSSTP